MRPRDRAIGAALNRTPQTIRVKAIELGIRLRPPSLDTRRIKLTFGTWAVLEGEARRFNMRPSKLARLVVEVLDGTGAIIAYLTVGMDGSSFNPRGLVFPDSTDLWIADALAPGVFSVTSSDFTPTPLPAALPLFATGLGGLGLLGWRRKRKAAA
jgi:hypothetical protein